MAYFGGTGRPVGDPGFFSTIRKIGGAVGRGIVKTAFPALGNIFDQSRPRGSVGQLPGLSLPITGGKTQGMTIGKDGVMRKRRQRMNVGNVKALKRSIRRTDGFVKLAKDALKNTGFTVVSKSSQATRRATEKASARRHHRT